MKYKLKINKTHPRAAYTLSFSLNAAITSNQLAITAKPDIMYAATEKYLSIRSHPVRQVVESSNCTRTDVIRNVFIVTNEF